MQKDTALTVVRVLAVLEWACATCGLLLTLLFLVGGPLLAHEIVNDPELATQLADLTAAGGASLLTVVFVLLGVFFLIITALSVITGVGLWRLRNWGRVLCLIVSWICGVWSAFGLAFAPFGENPVSGVLWNLLFVAMSAVYIWLLQFEPAVVGLFASKETSDAKKKKA